jgi:hypothetical protein
MNPTRLLTTVAICRLGFIALLGAIGSAQAASSAHYTPGFMNIRDFFLGAPGWYVVDYNYFYTSDQFNDRDGNAVNSITIKPGPGPGVTLKVSPSVDIYAQSPTLIWIAPWKLDDVKFGAYIAPSFANSNIDAEISSLQGRGVNATTSSFGVGDLFVQPIWLGYTMKHWDFSLAYGFYAPVGRYNTVTLKLPIVGPVTTTSPDNIGEGFWTHQIQGAMAWYPWADQRTAVTAALTYEINSSKEGIDMTPGQHLTLNWGISQYLPLTKDQKLLVEIGPAGYDDWQVTDDTGSAATNPTVHQQVHAAGGQVGLVYVPWSAALEFHAFDEFSATARLQGAAYGITAYIKF